MMLRTCSWLGLLALCACADDSVEVDSSIVDAGPDIRLSAHPVSSCSGIFEEEEGASCEPWVECDERRLWCTRRHAECSLGILEFDDADEWSGPDVECAFGAASVTVESTAGTFELDGSLGSFAHEFSPDARVYFFTGDVVACPEPKLSLDRVFPTTVSTYVGSHVLGGTVVLGEDRVRVEGELTITTDERPDDYAIELEGELVLEGEGVSVVGAFRTIECPELRRNNL